MKSTFAYSGSPSRPSPIGILRSIASNSNAWSRSSPTARRTAAPGRGGTKVSGSSRVVLTSAASTVSAGSTPSATRKTSESNRAPSWRARTWVTTPGESDRPLVAGEGAVGDHDVVELEVLVGRERDPERQRRAVLGPDDAPDRRGARGSSATCGPYPAPVALAVERSGGSAGGHEPVIRTERRRLLRKVGPDHVVRRDLAALDVLGADDGHLGDRRRGHGAPTAPSGTTSTTPPTGSAACPVIVRFRAGHLRGRVRNLLRLPVHQGDLGQHVAVREVEPDDHQITVGDVATHARRPR